jgi:hypothetical protein
MTGCFLHIHLNMILAVLFHVTRMVENRKAYRVLVGKPDGKRPLWRRSYVCKDNIKTYLNHRRLEQMDCTRLTQGRYSWPAMVKTVMTARFHKTGVIYLPAEELTASQKVLRSMEFVLSLRRPSAHFQWVFRTKILHEMDLLLIRATCPAHPNFLYFIILTILCDLFNYFLQSC